MSRRPRPDLQPEIVLPDGTEQETRANEAIDNDWRARVYPRGQRPINDDWMVKFAELHRRLSQLRLIGAGINEGLLHFMMEHCGLAATSPKLDRNGQAEFRDGGRVAILRRVGCRVRMMHQQIADRYGFKARTTVTDHIKKFKEHGLIVNCGHDPTTITETSPDNFQVWIAVSNDELPIPVATQLARLLEQRYSTDTGSADAFHLGRLPGLRNKKPKYRDHLNDGGPLVRLHRARDVPKIPDGIRELVEEAAHLAADRPPSSSSSAHGACAPITNIDIDPSRSPMTPDESREIYAAELMNQAKRKGSRIPIKKGLRSHADYAVVYSLRVQYGYDQDDLAALLQYESAKAAERGVDYVLRTVYAAL